MAEGPSRTAANGGVGGPGDSGLGGGGGGPAGAGGGPNGASRGSGVTRAGVFSASLPAITALLIVGALILAIAEGIFHAEHQLLDALQDSSRARGLITLLIAITTVGIALLLTITTIFDSGTDAEREKRFDRSKQVLSVMIGILGTIVGFYFGSEKVSPAQREPFAVSSVKFSQPQAAKGAPFQITLFISGGKAPYKYQIAFDPPVPGLAIITNDSLGGQITESVTVPSTLDTDKDVACRISVSDSDNKSIEYEDASQKISLRSK